MKAHTNMDVKNLPLCLTNVIRPILTGKGAFLGKWSEGEESFSFASVSSIASFAVTFRSAIKPIPMDRSDIPAMTAKPMRDKGMLIEAISVGIEYVRRNVPIRRLLIPQQKSSETSKATMDIASRYPASDKAISR